MPHIILSEEQTRTLVGTSESVEVRDGEGRLLAFLKPLDPHEVEAIQRFRERREAAVPAPIPSGRVQAMMAELNALDQNGQVTQEKVDDALRRAGAGATQ
jgi:hypothetical protein